MAADSFKVPGNKGNRKKVIHLTKFRTKKHIT